MPAQVDPSGLVAGLHAVQALLESRPREVNRVVLARGWNNPRLHALQKMAQEQGIRVHQLPKSRLDSWYGGPHQGVLAFRHSRALDDWQCVREELLEHAARGGAPHIVLPAAIEDPRNLGAIVRTAAALSVDAVLLPEKGLSGLTPAAAKAAAGALEQIPICRTGNLAGELKRLREGGFSVVGLDAGAEKPLHRHLFRGPLVFVVGGEDRGIPPHIARNCDISLRIPIAASVHSYNASVALALLLYEAARQGEFSRLDPAPPAPRAAE